MKSLAQKLMIFCLGTLSCSVSGSLFCSSAEAKGLVQTCHLEGRIDLTANTDFQCTEAGKDFVIAPNTLIVTHGYSLTIFTLNNVQMDLTIRSFEEDHSAKSQDAASISITGLSADGRLNIFNDGLGEEGQSGDVSLKFLSVTHDFKKRVMLDASEATLRVDIQNQG